MNALDLYKPGRGVIALLIAALVWGNLPAADLSSDNSTTLEGDKLTRSAAGFSDERPDTAPRDPAALEEMQSLPEPSPERSDGSAPSRLESTIPFGIRIYDADTELFYDLDRDGYYHYLRVSFDADTDFGDSRVFAMLYLRRFDGPWELYYVSEVFTIFGISPFDDYEVETELVAGYPAGLYDVLIELYDADFGILVDEFGPYESSALSLLPLEDATRDDVSPPPVTISRGGGGAASWLGLLMLLLAVPGWRKRLER